MVGTKAKAVCIAVLVLSTLLAPAVAAAATYNRWYLRNANTTGVGQIAFNYGDGTQTPLAGDWNGDGRDTPGVFQASTGRWWLANSFDGTTQAYFAYGSPGMTPVVGDWNGDRWTSVGVKTGGRWHVSNSNSSAPASSSFTFGNPSGDIPLAGDWDGNGTQTPGIYRTSNRAFYLSNSPTGSLVSGIAYGIAGDIPVVGDWNGDNRDSIGIFRPSTSGWWLSNGLDSTAEIAFGYGSPGDIPVVGDWDGNGTDTAGVVRRIASSTPPPPPPAPREIEREYSYYMTIDVPNDADDFEPAGLAATAEGDEPEEEPDEAPQVAEAGVSELSGTLEETIDGATTVTAVDPGVVEQGEPEGAGLRAAGAAAGVVESGTCVHNDTRKNFVIYKPRTHKTPPGYDTYTARTQLHLYKQKYARRPVNPKTGHPKWTKQFLACVAGGAAIVDPDDDWRLAEYRNHVWPRSSEEDLLISYKWGTGVVEGAVTQSLSFQLGVPNVMSVSGSVTVRDRDIFNGRVGRYPDVNVGPDGWEDNMVSSFWRDEGTGGSPDWQGNVALALYERWQRRPNVKFRFGQGYRIRQLGES